MPSFQTTTGSRKVVVPNLTKTNFKSWRAAITLAAESLGISDFYKQDVVPPKRTGNAQVDAAKQVQHRKDEHLAFLILAWTAMDAALELKLGPYDSASFPFDMYKDIMRTFTPSDQETCEALMAYYKLDIKLFDSPSSFLKEFLRLIEVLDQSRFKQTDVTKAVFLSHQFMLYEPDGFGPVYFAVQRNSMTYAEVLRLCTDFAEY